MKRQNPKSTSRVSERDRKILDHVARYRLTINQVLHRLFFPDNGQSAVAKVTGRLCSAKRLAKFKLRHPRVYFTLTAAEAQNRGLSISRAQSLGPKLCRPSTRCLPTRRLVPFNTVDWPRQNFSSLARGCLRKHWILHIASTNPEDIQSWK